MSDVEGRERWRGLNWL